MTQAEYLAAIYADLGLILGRVDALVDRLDRLEAEFGPLARRFNGKPARAAAAVMPSRRWRPPSGQGNGPAVDIFRPAPGLDLRPDPAADQGG